MMTSSSIGALAGIFGAAPLINPFETSTMKRNPQVIVFMTPFPYSVDIDAPLAEGYQLMREHGVHHLPVMENGVIAGVLTDRDIKLVLGPDFERSSGRELRARDAYVEKPCVVSASTPVATVARMLAENHIGSAVVTKHDKMVGIFTATDACRALAEIIDGHHDEPDEAA